MRCNLLEYLIHSPRFKRRVRFHVRWVNNRIVSLKQMLHKMIGSYRFRLSVVAIGFCAIALAGWAVSLPAEDWKIAGPFGGTAISIALDPQHPNIVLAGARN